MRIRLIENWKDVLLKAWSVRLILLAGLFSGLQAAMGVVPVEVVKTMPTWLWPIATLIVTGGALASRIIMQENLKK